MAHAVSKAMARPAPHWSGPLRWAAAALAMLAAPVACPAAPADATSNATSAFVRLRADGSALAAGRLSKRATADWACTRDQRTGLIWERKTAGGLRDGHASFTPYRREWDKAGRIVGYRDDHSGQCARDAMAGGSCNIAAYVDAVNQARLCGRDDWRLPTIPELIQVTGDGGDAGHHGRDTLMPGLVPGWYWTSTEEHGGLPYPRVALLPPGGSPQLFDGTYFLWLVSGNGKEARP